MYGEIEFLVDRFILRSVSGELLGLILVEAEFFLLLGASSQALSAATSSTNRFLAADGPK